MFLVTDNLEERRQKIERFLSSNEPAIAVLLAAADCERTIRRAILSLGTTPTKELAYQLGRPRPIGSKGRKYRSSVDGYADAWTSEVEPRFGVALKCGIVHDWTDLTKAFQLRHDLIHGDKGTTGLLYASKQVHSMMDATERVHNFALQHGFDLTKRLRMRLEKKPAKS